MRPYVTYIWLARRFRVVFRKIYRLTQMAREIQWPLQRAKPTGTRPVRYILETQFVKEEYRLRANRKLHRSKQNPILEN